jgi:hypothetical protein
VHFVEGAAVLDGEDGVGVAGAAGLAFERAGVGRFLGVAAICFSVAICVFLFLLFRAASTLFPGGGREAMDSLAS